MLITLLINGFAFFSSYLLAGRYFSKEKLTYRLLAGFAFFYGQIILILLFWGILGKLYPGNIVFLSFLLFFISFFSLKNKPRVKDFFSLPWDIPKGKAIILCLALLTGFLVVKAVINLVNPPFGWDSINYHFTFPVEWLKHANLDNPITINDDLGPTYYPINGSLIYFWFIFPLKNVFLADLGQLPFFALSFLSIYGISRRLSVSREYSFFAAALFSLTPNYFKQIEIAYVDVMVCGWFLFSLYFLFEFYHRRKISDVVLFSTGLGLLIGTKTTAVLFAGVLYSLFIIVLISLFGKVGFKKQAGFIFLSVFLIIAFGGYSYIRNFISTGNPLYPMKIGFLGKVIFKGVFDKTNYASHVLSSDYSLPKLLFHEGLGLGTLIFLIPGFVIAIVGIIRKKINVERLLLCIIPPLMFLIWRYLIPLANVRYLYAALGVGYIVAFMGLSTKKEHRIFIRILVVLCALAASAEISNRMELIFSLLVSAGLFFYLEKIYGLLLRIKLKGWVVILCAAALALFLLNKDYNKNEYSRYVTIRKYSGFWEDALRAWEWLNRNTLSDNIAYVGRPVAFPLYGENFKNNVFYVSVNSVDPVKIHYLPNSNYKWGSDFLELHKSLQEEGNYRQHADYSVWLSNLKKRPTDYLFVYSLHQTKDIVFPVEDEWAGKHPDIFASVYANKTVHIYKIN